MRMHVAIVSGVQSEVGAELPARQLRYVIGGAPCGLAYLPSVLTITDYPLPSQNPYWISQVFPCIDQPCGRGMVSVKASDSGVGYLAVLPYGLTMPSDVL